MGCCSEFGEYGVPFFLEKLSSTVIETKVQITSNITINSSGRIIRNIIGMRTNL
jgi:hypothetical protein